MEEKITKEELFNRRREFLKLGAGSIASAYSIGALLSKIEALEPDLQPTAYESISNYVNFYEFSINKPKAVKLAQKFSPKNWVIDVAGEVQNPMKLNMMDIAKFKQVSRVYRFRCVEAWSMIVPWSGIELRELIDFIKPTSKAKYIKFTTLYDKKVFPDQGSFFPALKYPYVEVLRLDEAMHPLVLLATGIYNKPLAPQNGAPIRLVVPWKYGFKSIKSIVKIELLENKESGTWELTAPNEYGFYANVNPNVSHPRWSQAMEVRLGEIGKIPTLLFNGYEKEVGNLYKDLDLKVNY